MPGAADAAAFCDLAERASTMAELTELLVQASKELGFDCVTLAHHVDPMRPPTTCIGFSTYPEAWMQALLDRRYVSDDPVLLASERSAAPIVWSRLPQQLELTSRQKGILAAAAEHGLRDGFTVPAHVPGEPFGSCSFGSRRERAISAEICRATLWVGAFAFHHARRIVGLAQIANGRVRLTQRQLDCVVLVGQGKSDGVIAQLLGISPQTVHEHLEAAKRRYGVATRAQLVACSLADGQLTYTDLLVSHRR